MNSENCDANVCRLWPEEGGHPPVAPSVVLTLRSYPVLTSHTLTDHHRPVTLAFRAEDVQSDGEGGWKLIINVSH